MSWSSQVQRCAGTASVLSLREPGSQEIIDWRSSLALSNTCTCTVLFSQDHTQMVSMGFRDSYFQANDFSGMGQFSATKTTFSLLTKNWSLNLLLNLANNLIFGDAWSCTKYINWASVSSLHLCIHAASDCFPVRL